MSSAFLKKLRIVYYRASTLLRRWSTIYFFLKIFFLKQLVLDTYSKNNLRWVLFIAKLQSEHCRLVTLLTELDHWLFSEKFSNFSNQLFFATFLFMKKQITWKITWKLSQEKLGKGRLFGPFTLSVSQHQTSARK